MPLTSYVESNRSVQATYNTDHECAPITVLSINMISQATANTDRTCRTITEYNESVETGVRKSQLDRYVTHMITSYRTVKRFKCKFILYDNTADNTYVDVCETDYYLDKIWRNQVV